MSFAATISKNLSLPVARVDAVLKLLKEDHTVPFIARYRKEVTGNLDEVQIAAIEREAERCEALEKRKTAVRESLQEQGLLTPDRENQLNSLVTLQQVEDFYLPFRPKRKTRASVAREAGYEPAAQIILANGDFPSPNPWSAEALAGAQDIVSEVLSESAAVRATLREGFLKTGRVVCSQPRGHTGENPYHEHLNHTEPLATIPGYRLLAILRGVEEEHLRVSVEIDAEKAVAQILRAHGAPGNPRPLLKEAAADAWKRLLEPSLENEALQTARAAAEAGAIGVFANNLRGLLLASPLGQKRILALDPGFRTGSKAAVLSAQGAILEHGVVYALEPHNKTQEAETKIRDWVGRHKLEAVAVGNGTGGREMASFLQSLELGIPVFSVNESGASVYSASEVAREEFPELDLTVRGAVSIGRRLIDPLAELVKVDPKAIGVGQYQHDVNPKDLKRSLDEVVVSCVNQVGVDVNTATKPLLSYVSGLNPRLAAAIVEFRNKQGPFRSRKELLKVKGLGEKAFQQAAGFLRIRDGEQPLDASAVHPESYPVVEQIAARLGSPVNKLLGQTGLRTQVWPLRSSLEVGEETLKDILSELERPGRDPRPVLETPVFDDAIRTMDDLREGMVLTGLVTNVTDFGAFVDIGIHQDGLVHVSQLADTFVKKPLDVVKVGQKVMVKVLQVDKEKKRISLSRKGLS